MSELTTTPIEPKPDFLSRPLLAALNIDWEKAIYIAFILFAIVTRFWDLGSRVMSHDESLHTQFSYQYYDGQGFSHTPLMHGPFLFHATAVSYWLFGASDFSARVPVAILGILLVVMPYFLRNWIGRIGALFASFTFLISPYILYYSRYIRHDIYVIIWALIIVISIWYYLRTREEKYLWWFAAGNALMFSTKEVSFIYVAIFGSFLVLRLLGQVLTANWLRSKLKTLQVPLIVIALGVLMAAGGVLIERDARATPPATATTEAGEGFAADPSAEATAAAAVDTSERHIGGWIVIFGIGVLSGGLFLLGRAMRPQIDDYPEFDLIVLFTTLLLPMVTPLFTFLAGWDPRDYTYNSCVLAGQETMSAVQLFLNRAGQPECRDAFFSSGLVHTGGFLVIAMLVSILVGLWWHKRRWVIAAAIFHTIFLVLYTSIFTNLSGWASGMIGSLGYWLEQQEVQRGSQPWFYYFFVTPFYEFLPILFSYFAVRLWLAQQRIERTVGYWVNTLLLALLSYSLVRWIYETATQTTLVGQPESGATSSNVIGLIAGLVVIGLSILLWFFAWRKLLQKEQDTDSLTRLVDFPEMFQFVPFLIWWVLLTWLAYSYAGEKMPWLSTHFVIPMAFLVGWYFNEKLKAFNLKQLLSRESVLLFGFTVLLIVAVFLVVSPLWLGKIQLGDQGLQNLQTIGRFLGSLLVAVGIYFGWRRIREQVDPDLRRPLVILGWFAVLSLLTIRFAYMAAFPNADYTTEFMVYAHGAPATKEIVMEQVEELSMRLYGDKGIKVAFSSDVSWPYTWYLRDYPNRVFFGQNPSNTLNESPVIIVGRNDWERTEPYLGNNYEYRAYTFLWWPMEDYRRISWNAILGDPNAAEFGQVRRGLGNAGVREALYNIFFYRDYAKYEEVFGGSYTPSEWPLRHELRLYIRKDVLANLWDYGVGPVYAEGLSDPYEEGELLPSPSLVINEIGIPGMEPGQLNAPRNVAIGEDDRIYVADSGNHRIQVFDAQGNYLTGWGEFGTAPGQFNEPWGLAVDGEFVYVADTWNHRIQKFTLNGGFVGTFGQSGSIDGGEASLGLFFGPRSVVLLADNRLLVTDTGNHRMQVLTRDGEFLQQVGGFGNQPGQMNEPVGLATALDGTIYLADTWNGRIQQFLPELFPIFEWRVEAWTGQSINNKPYLATDSLGRVYVTDPEGYRVLIFNPAGEYLARFGQFGADMNSLGLPNGIAIDAQNNIYIADAGNHRLLKFNAIFGAPAPTVPIEEPAEEQPVEEAPTEGAGLELEDGVGETAVSPTPEPSPTPEE